MENIGVYPSNIEMKYNYLNIDGKYVSVISIIDCTRNIEIFNTIKSVLRFEELEVSFHYSRKNAAELLKRLTSIIANSNSEMKTISKNQIDINLIDSVKQKALQLRKDIQIKNEQIYSFNAYLTVKSKDLNNLVIKTKYISDYLYSNGIIAKPCNFRQKEAYIATLPIMDNDNVLKKYTENIITESTVATLFPFFSEAIQDANGVVLGKSNNNECIIDIFDKKNNNYNMCIFGSSGAGKSYFVKLMLLKNMYIGTRQIVIDPEGEYTNIIKSMGGKVYREDSYNLFEIEESFIKNNNDFFEMKIDNVERQISEITEIKKDKIYRSIIIKLYEKYGINSNKESLYRESYKETFYTRKRYTDSFPTVKEFIQEVNKSQKFSSNEKIEIETRLKKYGYVKTGTSTNDSNLYCFDLEGENLQRIANNMNLYIDKIEELITSNTIIYFDELWKCICTKQDNQVIEYIYKLFKTLRKRKAAIVIITQDIGDIFSIDKGNFAKSIINNSNIKVFFKMDWTDIDIIERILNSDKDMFNKIKHLSRGHAYINYGISKFVLEVKSTNHEHQLIEGDNER